MTQDNWKAIYMVLKDAMSSKEYTGKARAEIFEALFEVQEKLKENRNV